jgi:hypothetical protein
MKSEEYLAATEELAYHKDVWRLSNNLDKARKPNS